MDDVLPRSEINHDARLLAAHKLLLLRSLLSGSSEQDTGEGAYGFQTTLPAVSLSNKYSHWPLSPQCEVFRLHCMPPFIAMEFPLACCSPMFLRSRARADGDRSF